MSDVREGFPLDLEHVSPLAGKIAAPAPEAVTDPVFVTLDALYEPEQPFKHGPLKWQSRGAGSFPAVGDPCVVLELDTGELWVVAWSGSSGEAISDLPDPSGEPDGEWLMTASGAAVWVPAAAGLVPIVDAGGYFAATDVEGALQELGASSGGGGGGGGIGATELIYRYTVTGSDKASIDTGIDTPDAGSNVWSNGDLLEVWLYVRTDEAVVRSLVDVILNNDSGANYTRSNVQMTESSTAGQTATGENAIRLNAAGASAAANDFSSTRLEIPNFTGTVGNKIVQYQEGVIDDGATANNRQLVGHYGYKSTSAVTRLKAAPETSGKKFKVGAKLLIYKRLDA